MANSVLARMAVIISANTAQFNASLKQSQNAFLGFTSSIKSLGNTIGLSLGGVAAFQGVKAVIGTMADFEATMSEVKAITGATGKDFKALEKDAIKLGGSTKFTATQVGQLQIAYGRLGFSTKEILNATAATLDLAAATGEDLAKSADVAGSTVRGFELNAKETIRVVDVMAASFNQTALGLENFTESMKYVAPVANAAGATVEQTTALLGVLADAGIRGSMAGTSLRKIFTDMTKDGRPLKERLKELGDRGITLADSFDEVGRTAQTSLLILSKNTDKIDQLSKSFENAGGEAAKMARIMQDNLTGDVVKLTSAWEGLVIKMSNTGWMREVVQDFTAFINAIAGNPDIYRKLDKMAEALSKNASDIGKAGFIETLKDLRREAGKPIDVNVVQELAEKYKLTDQQANELYSTIIDINKSLSFQEKALKQFNEFAERNGYTDLNKAAEDYKNRLYELILAEQIQREGYRKSSMASEDAAKAFAPVIKAADDQIAAYRRVINILVEFQKTLTKTSEVVSSETIDSTVTLSKLREQLKKINDEFANTNVNDLSRLSVLKKQADEIDRQIQALENLNISIGKQQLQFIPDLEAEGSTNQELRNEQDVNHLKSLTEELNKVATSAEFAGGAFIKLEETTTTTTKKMEGEIADFSKAIADSFVAIGQIIGELVSGTSKEFEEASKQLAALTKGTAEYQAQLEVVESLRPNFGKKMLAVLAEFAAQVGEILIGIGTAMLAAQRAITNPYLAIGAGIALVALAGILGASLKDAQSSFNSGGGGGGRVTSGRDNTGSLTAKGLEIAVGGEFTIKGDDLVYIFNRKNQLNGRTNG